MKVAFDMGPSESRSALRGIGMYAKELIKSLQLLPKIEIYQVDASHEDVSRYDLVHYPSFPIHTVTLPKQFTTKSVITIHDMIYLIFPEAYPLGFKGKLKFYIQKRRIKNADAIITVSETSKKDIIRFLNIPPEKITVIHNGPQTVLKHISLGLINQTKEKYDLPNTFVLYIGDVNYNKNLLRLAEACVKIETPLVIVGKQAKEKDFDRAHPENKAWVKFLERYESNPLIKRVGFLESDELAAIWKLATVYCQPSLYEGFGMPVLESFSQGVPVVASRTQALVEIGSDACEYVDPYSYESIAVGIKKVLNDKKLQSELTKNGTRRLKDFSWQKAALQTVGVYKKVLQK